MESGSAITRSLRSRISRDRGPGISVFSWIARVTATRQTLSHADGAAAGERAGRVDPERIPEQEAARVQGAGRVDLRAQVCRGVGPPEREILQPRHEARGCSVERRLEIQERV